MQLLESLDRPEYQYLLNDAGTFRIEGGRAARNAVPATGPMAQGIALDAYNVVGFAPMREAPSLSSVEISQVKTFGTIDDEDDLVVDSQQNIVQSEEPINEFTIEIEEA